MIHVCGAILLIGNIMTAAFWKMRADRSCHPAIIHSAAKGVMTADLLFTLPGIALLIISGFAMSAIGGYSFGEFHWLTLSLVLFILTGIIWVFLLLPLQRKMIRLSAEGLTSGTIPAGYRRASLYWNIYGTIAVLLPIAILYLMISKVF